MKRRLRSFFLTVCLLAANVLPAQHQTINGFVVDVETGEKLISAHIYSNQLNLGTSTNEAGFFSLLYPSKDSVKLFCSYIGYSTQVIQAPGNTDEMLIINMKRQSTLTTVEVDGSKVPDLLGDESLQEIALTIKEIENVPSILGESDVLKAIQLLPGVKSGSEGQSGLYVRGGSMDQNLILLDGVPVYNVSHALGIFSVFNVDAINSINFIKGGFPARYGGRLSSVVEINMKEGNLRKFQGRGSIGLLSSKLTLEVPIKKQKTSLLISGRRTYLDLLTRPFFSAALSSQNSRLKPNVYFYDTNLKLRHKLSKVHHLVGSLYLSQDVFHYKYVSNRTEYGGGIKWNNNIASIKWNWRTGGKSFLHTTLLYSNYQNRINSTYSSLNDDGSKNSLFAQYNSENSDLGIRTDLDVLISPNYQLRVGGQFLKHNYVPGAITSTVDLDSINIDTVVGSQAISTLESNWYFENQLTLGNFVANFGVHAAGYWVRNENYWSVQPRLSLSYLFERDIGFHLAYSSMSQYINLLTSETISLPTDLWVPVTEVIPPQHSWQLAFGVSKNFPKNLKMTIQGYLKKMNNVLSYKEGASFILDWDADLYNQLGWEEKVSTGTGEAYGIEYFLHKKNGRTTGWIGYTLSWNFRKFQDINNGIRYPHRYDRRHDISLVVNHKFNEKIRLAGTWVFRTGDALTLPTYRFPLAYQYYFDSYDNTEYEWFDELAVSTRKNSFRMSSYHRLDLSLEFRKVREDYERSWVISLYNVYFHANPYFIVPDLAFDNSNTVRSFKEISLIPFMLPALSYNFKF